MKGKQIMRKLISAFLIIILLAITGEAFCSPVSAVGGFTKENVDLSLVSDKKGNIIYDKKASWNLTAANKTNVDLAVEVLNVIKDSNGAVVWSNTQNIVIPAKTVQVTGISAESLKYGIYTIDVTLTGTFGKIEKSGGFSCMKKNMVSNDFMGTQTHFIWSGRDYADYNLPLITDSGFGVVRDHIEWAQIDVSSENGIPSNVVEFVDKIHASGQKLILNIGNSHPLYDNGGLPVSSEALLAYRNLCTYVAERFKGKVYAYEIWNEPDYFDAFTNGISNTGTQYCEVLKTAYSAINAADKDALVFGGAITAIGYTSLGLDNAALDYMQEMLAAGAANYMDVFSFHPYANTGYYFDENVRTTLNPENQIALARQTLDSAGAKDIPIWITEIGTSSYDNENKGYTELEQAVNLQRMVMIAKTEHSVLGMSVYNHREKGTDPSDFEQNFGIINSDYTAKPACVGLSFLNDFLVDAEFVEKVTDGNQKYYRFKDKYDESDIFAFWTTGGKTDMLALTQNDKESVNVIARTLFYPNTHIAYVYDMYGNEISGQSITVGEEPVYIKCSSREINPKINVKNGHVSVSGKIKDESGFVTVVVYKNILDRREIVYVKQVCAENSHGYNAEFDISGNDLYGICVYDGKQSQSFINNSPYDISVELYNENGRIESMEKIKNGDTVTASLEIKDTTENGGSLAFFGVLYGDDGTLAEAKKSDIQWRDDKTGESSAVFEIKDITKVKEFKLMLWDNHLRPIINSITVK